MPGDKELVEAEILCRRLLEDGRFFDRHGVLNSDGRKLLNRIVRIVVKKIPYAKSRAYVARREPTLENVARLLEVIRTGDSR